MSIPARRSVLRFMARALKGIGRLATSISPAIGISTCNALSAGLITLSLVSAEGASAASTWYPRVWQTEEGLPENSVTGVVQTPEGYLWVATHGGLARFDGARFQRVVLPRSDVGLPRRMIRAAMHGKGETVWLALEGGVVVSLSQTATNAFTTADGLPRMRPFCLAQAGDGAVWIGYADGSACRIHEGQVTRFGPADGLTGSGGCWLVTGAGGQVYYTKGGNLGVFQEGRFRSLLALHEGAMRIGTARDGGLWVVAGDRLLRYREGQVPVELGRLAAIHAGTEASVLFEDQAGALWIGTTASGLFRYADSKFEKVETSHEEILSISEDHEGNIWVGTGGGGLNRLRPRVLELQGPESGLPSRVVRSICEDASGVLWATEQNGTLVRYNGQRWTVVTREAGWSGAQATCVAADTVGTVWIGTFRGGLYRWRNGEFTAFQRTDGLAGDSVRALAVDTKGSLWIGLEFTNCVQRLENDSFQTFALPVGSQPVRAIAEDTAGSVWLGTGGGTLFRCSGDRLVEETPRPLSARLPIRCLHATPDGSLWIGYAVSGLARLRDGHFAPIGTEQGLPDDYISQIISDGHGWMWLAGNHGIFQVRQAELDKLAEGMAIQLQVRTYGKDEGLPNLQASYGYAPGALRKTDGTIWIPMLTGLAVVHPDRVALSEFPPPVLIERLIVDGHTTPLPERTTPTTIDPAQGATASGQSKALLRLPPSHRRVEFEYTAPSFVAPENIKFRHRLDGLDDDWVEADHQRVASYSRLPAGSYKFHVTACNNLGVWNTTGATLSFVVAPFLWQTWWFRIGTGGALLLLVATTIRTVERRRVQRRLDFLERQHAIERERIRIARDIHDELGAGLTQIGLLADLGTSHTLNQEGVRLNLQKIEGRARAALTALDEIVWAVNPRNDNLTRLADYLCHVADECFESGPIRCRKNVPTGLPPVPVATELRHNLTLAVKEALANVLKHSAADVVWLRLKWDAPELVVSVEDNGVGFDPGRPPSAVSNGLRNQANRMKDIGGTVEIASVPGHGTNVQFRIRLRGCDPVTPEIRDSHESN